MAKRDIFVIGGSAGSGVALKEIVRGLPKDFPGSVFITTHVPSNHESHLAEMLSNDSGVPVSRATDGQPIEPGRVYVAAPDRHLLLLGSTLRMGAGPRENMARPAIDPMFRSAALSFGPRVVGVVLSGMLNDGASGLSAVKRSGGAAIVQHPVDALVDEMPRAAIETVDVDYVARAGEIAEIMGELARSDAGPASPASAGLILEVELAAGGGLGSEVLRRFADPVALTCPDCDGVLSEMKGEHPLRYRCQVGHAYTADHLAAHGKGVDEAIRVALRVMEERVELVSRMARDARESGRRAVAELYHRRAEEYRAYATTLRTAALGSLGLTRKPDEEPL